MHANAVKVKSTESKKVFVGILMKRARRNGVRGIIPTNEKARKVIMAW